MDPSTPQKVTVLLHPVGDAPILKNKKYTVDPSRDIAWFTATIRKMLNLPLEKSLFLFVSQSFAPSPDHTFEMLGLVDYGSDSDGSTSGNEEGTQKRTTIDNKSSKAAPSKPLLDSEDNFFGDESGMNDDSPSIKNSISVTTEDTLEELVKPKDWELKLAEKARKKLKKKLKKERKEKKKAKKGDMIAEKNTKDEVNTVAVPVKKKAQISAFGALSSIAVEGDTDSEDETPKIPSSTPSHTGGHGLLSMLPAPKTARIEKGNGKQSIMLPPSMRKKPVDSAPQMRPAVQPITKRPLVDADNSDDSDGEMTDFFGLSSVKEPVYKNPRMDSVPLVPTSGLDEVAGPSRPQPQEYVHPSEMYDNPLEEEQGVGQGVLTNADAHRLIVKHEHDFGGRSLGDALNNIVDVSVDDALGPDVHATLLRNLTSKAFAKSAMAPLPKAANVRDRTAKQKHQITYLAHMAVAREEALQEQWAENRHNKKAAGQKYGF